MAYEQVQTGLKTFSEIFKGQLWIEIMLIDGINDDDESLAKYKRILEGIRYDRLYLNTPVRPPAEPYARAVSPEKMKRAVEVLGGISIDMLATEGFHSEIPDNKEAVLSIIKRHPMNQFEIEGFLKSRGCGDPAAVIVELRNDGRVETILYKGYETFRLR
jgi:wyosine [tRNA(Phe)-imidazoG37] synthetase (radical SAM superfamily)